jgi:hypothetical protein
MYNPKNVFGMKEVKVHKDKGVYPCKDAPKPDMSGVKTSGIKMRGAGAATKGFMCRGPMA